MWFDFISCHLLSGLDINTVLFLAAKPTNYTNSIILLFLTGFQTSTLLAMYRTKISFLHQLYKIGNLLELMQYKSVNITVQVEVINPNHIYILLCPSILHKHVLYCLSNSQITLCKRYIRDIPFTFLAYVFTSYPNDMKTAV
jgi:hypothetical protein